MAMGSGLTVGRLGVVWAMVARLCLHGNPPPKVRRKSRVNVLGKLLPIWKARLERLRTHAAIFGGIDAALRLHANAVQTIHKLQGIGAAIGKIEREGHAGHGERQHARRRDIAKHLEHR